MTALSLKTGWTQDPWTPSITTDKGTGLGAADTKGAIAAILTALETRSPHNVG
ncbi:MAG TPA: M20/M25/M40 family metallo-hydrolase, partial [Nitrospirales bacterium]|nr:M20/M25/M40 family metallo-hydrolase [Nitrospirales bacterium]